MKNTWKQIFISGYCRNSYFSETTINTVRSISSNFPGGHINTTDGILSLQVQANSPNIILLLLGYGIIFASISIITYQVKVIFSNFKKNLPFNALNINRIRSI